MTNAEKKKDQLKSKLYLKLNNFKYLWHPEKCLKHNGGVFF